MNVGVIIRRGAIQIKIEGEGACEVIDRIFDIAEKGASRQEIMRQFDERDGSPLSSLIDFLASRNFLIPCDESPLLSVTQENCLDVFYWHFDPTMNSISSRISTVQLAIIGINKLSRALVSALVESQFQRIATIDHPTFTDADIAAEWPDRVGRLIPFERWDTPENWKEVQCLIVCSDVGGGNLLLELNRSCIAHATPFLPVVLKEFSGLIGPLTLPGETACYECLVSRENSNLSEYQMRRIAEQSMPQGRAVIAHHPTMHQIVANLAAFELLRFFGASLPGASPGTLIEINVLATALKKRKVLKAPRCKSCSPMHQHPSHSPYRDDAITELRETP